MSIACPNLSTVSRSRGSDLVAFLLPCRYLVYGSVPPDLSGQVVSDWLVSPVETLLP